MKLSYLKVKYDEKIFQKKLQIESDKKINQDDLRWIARSPVGAKVKIHGKELKITRVLKKAAARQWRDFDKKNDNIDQLSSNKSINSSKQSDNEYRCCVRFPGCQKRGIDCSYFYKFLECINDLLLANVGPWLEACLWWLDFNLGGHFYSPKDVHGLSTDVYRFLTGFEVFDCINVITLSLI